MTRATLVGMLEEGGATYELLAHAHTETAAEEARALGLAPDEVAKTLVVKTPEGYLRAAVPASCRLDLRKVRELVGGSKKHVHLATEDDLGRDYAEFELGAVPPFGGRSDPVLVDRRLAEQEAVVLEAGSHEQSVRVRTADLIRLTGARVSDICEE
jgi:Ala-tRNA(Pro) deacylase